MWSSLTTKTPTTRWVCASLGVTASVSGPCRRRHAHKAGTATPTRAGAARINGRRPRILKHPASLTLLPSLAPSRLVEVLEAPLVESRVTFVKGTIMDEEALLRAGANTAVACFVLSDG